MTLTMHDLLNLLLVFFPVYIILLTHLPNLVRKRHLCLPIRLLYNALPLLPLHHL